MRSVRRTIFQTYSISCSLAVVLGPIAFLRQKEIPPSDLTMELVPVFLSLLLLIGAAQASSYVVNGDYSIGEYGDKLDDNFVYEKRSCIRRGGSCDHRPNDCCFSSACRCNLWGTNCRCQRAGLFQRWGKK
ncbi:uncharacterized protein NPIL_1981 [Nephila pilipes]|uniref:U8-agatoxin-Ao1a n=1 Tax=Nephila pilipes TaxID=299642 RepID=A0A8X6TXJ9_NEPPI|nr:uncharacterized protein NPIL_1981 [Nephila pilipes]